MSSTGDTTTAPSNFQLIIDALVDHANQTGIDLSKNPFAEKIQLLSSPDDILELLEEREKAFKEYRDGDRKLISCLSPAVRVLHALSGILGEAITLAPFPPAKAVFVGIDVLLAAASGVSSSYDALLDLFDCVGNFLKRLEIYVKIPPTPTMIDIIVKVMVELLSVLTLATKQVKQGRFKKFAKKLLGDGEVETVLRRLDRLTQDEARVTVTQTFGVVHGLMNNMRIVMDDGKASTSSIRQSLVTLHQVVNDINKMKRDQLQREVQRWLSPPDPSTNHDFVSKARHKGTAAWFFQGEIVAEWKSRGSLLWIHGKPGSGKSTLLAAIIQDIESMRAAGLATMAYYYFDFRDSKKQNCYGLLSSLLSQLSAESDSCHDLLSQLYSANAGGTRKPTSITLAEYIKDMLRLPGQGPIYIVIDALDECPNVSGTPSAREEVLELVEELVDLNLPNLYFCVTSRPEIDIRMILNPLKPLQISLHDEAGQKEDIIKYIKSIVRSDRKMRRWREEDQKLVIDTLSERADGMFRWVVCQIDRLRRNFPASIRSVLAELPESLDQTYEQTLLGIDKEKRKYTRRLFQCLSVSIRPLRIEELAEILAVRFDGAGPPTFNPDWRPSDAEEAVLSACSSLISIVNVDDFQVVQFSHFSVKEFLTSDRLATADECLSYYHILPESAHTILAHASLSVLLRLDDTIDRHTIEQFPLAQYAARYWMDHAQFRNVSSYIQDVMEHLFDQAKPHFAAWIWLYDIDRHWMEPMSDIHPKQPEAVPLYYASLCGFRSLVEYLIVAHPSDINGKGGSYTTPLHAAAVKGHFQIAQLLLDNNADLNSCDHEGHAPLQIASRYGHLEVARRLLDSGGDVDIRNSKGRTPLHYASNNRKSQIAHFLIQRGAVVDARDQNQKTPLDHAVRRGNPEVVRLLINSGANVTVSDDGGWTPLHTAASYGNRDIAELLLVSGADLDARNYAQRTPLDIACGFGWLEFSHSLLERGSDLHSRDQDDWTPLHSASLNGHVDVVGLLLDRGADVYVHTAANRSTPLHFASAGGHLDTAKLLLQHGAIVDSRNDKDETPLDEASYNGHLEIACFLLGRGAATSSQDVKGWTPFHTASMRGHLHVVKFLLECGVGVDIRNGSEETSLDLASGSGKLDIVRFLIEEGADIHTKDNKGWNPLHIASQNGHLDIVRLLVDSGGVVDIRNEASWTPLALASRKGNVEVSLFLIEQGADTNARDNEGWAPLHLASRCGHVDMTQLLLDRGVGPNIHTDNLWNPLHLASANGHVKVARLLVLRGATVDVFDDEEQTPLGRAAGNGNVEIVCLLIDHGANLHSTDCNGCTPLHAASRSGHLKVVKLLLRRGADVDILDKTNRRAAELALENGRAEVASLLAEYKGDANLRHKIRSGTLDTAHQGADEDGKNEEKASLHTAARDGEVGALTSFLDRGADINSRDEMYKTSLHLAVAKGHLEVVRLLLERGAEVDSRDKFGRTPLHLASLEGHVEISRFLVDHGANVNARKSNYFTPIHLSASNGDLGVVELLLGRGVDIHVLTDEGETPYQLSLRRGHQKIADLLREHGAGGA